MKLIYMFFAHIAAILFNLSPIHASNKKLYYQVISEEGIPVFSRTSSEESALCGWIPGGRFIEVENTIEFRDYLKLSLVTQERYCVNSTAAFIREGFIEPALYAGPTNRNLISRWKSEVPNFSNRCLERSQGAKIIISFVGDLLLHGPLQRQAYSHPNGFSSLWRSVEHIFKDADLSYANLEGPTADQIDCRGRMSTKTKLQIGSDCRKDASEVYTSYPMFNYHPSLLTDLKRSGIGVLSTANNHSLDRFSIGANSTIEALLRINLPYTGTKRSASLDSYSTITTIRSKSGTIFRIAWIACTFSTNGIRDSNQQVLMCYRSNGTANPELLDLVSQLQRQSGIDGVIVTPHWGPTEYVHTVHPSQMTLGKQLIDAGAIAVIGAHPHVLQPWEVYKTPDGREGFIHYSLGNFVSAQTQAARRASVILLIGFQKNRSGQLTIDGIRYVPTYFARTQQQLELLPLNKDQRISDQGRESLQNILSIYPESLRLNSDERLTTCSPLSNN